VLEAVPFGEGRRASRRAQKAIALALLEVAAVPYQDTVVWSATENGEYFSYWMRGNAYLLNMLLIRRGLIVSAGGGMWYWEESEREVPLCDCDAWRLIAFEGPCPVNEEPALSVMVTMVDRITGEEIEISRIELPSSDGRHIVSYSSRVVPLGSVGPYLFVQQLEEGRTCEQDGAFSREEFAVIDLRTGEPADILNDQELDRIDSRERLEAFELVRSDTIADVRDASDLTLLAVEPRLDPGFGLGVNLRFGTEATIDAQGGAWTAAYAGTVLIPADWTPLSLRRFLIPPAVVRTYASGGSANLARGWSVVEVTPDNLLRALTTFAEP